MNKNPELNLFDEGEIPDWAMEPHPRDILKRQYEQAMKRMPNEAREKHDAALEDNVMEDILKTQIDYRKSRKPLPKNQMYEVARQIDRFLKIKTDGPDMVDIGMHYFVASNGPAGWVPLDTDGDGIPDYVEDYYGNGSTGSAATALAETDWLNPMSDGTNYDPSNAFYLNIDLGGAGIVGRIATNMNLNPFSFSNPLPLTQVITGLEPDIATFEIPINYNLLTNIGQLNLLVDGAAPLFQQCDQASNGLCLLSWNIDYSGWNPFLDPATGLTNINNQHYLCAQLVLAGKLAGPQNIQPNPTVYTATGPLLPFTANQLLQFEMFYGTFDDSGTTFFANLPEANAQYTIELYNDASGDFVLSITNSTSTGQISENWGITNADGSAYAGTTVDAVFNVTLPDYGGGSGSGGAFASAGTRTQKINRIVTGVQDGGFLVSYADAGATIQDAEWFANERGVVDYLMQTTTADAVIPNPYTSTYNVPDCDGTQGGGNPGFLRNQTQAAAMITNIGIIGNRNFFWNGHSSSTTLTDGSDNPGAEIDLSDVVGVLTNKVDMVNGTTQGHPYRFVFLNSCDSADDNGWCLTFGIVPNLTEAMVTAHPDRAQGFVGWKNKPRYPGSTDDFNALQETLALFFLKWQQGLPLAACTNVAENPNLAWPLNKQFKWNQTIFGINKNNFQLQISGYRGTTRTGFAPGF